MVINKQRNSPMINFLDNPMKPIWLKILISALALFLVAGCSDEPDRKLYDSSEVSEIGTTSANPGEDTGTQSPPALTNKQFSEGSGGALDDHPLVTEDQKNVNRKIIVPKSVEGKWKAVKILVRDKSDEERNTMQTVELGSTFQLGDSGITVNIVEFFPNFVLDDASYTSMDNTLGNPAIHLVITENGKELYNSWTFAKYPGLYAFEHPRYGLQLMDFIPMPTS